MIDTQMEQIKTNDKRQIELVEFKENYFYVAGFSNVGVVLTTEGVVVIDTSINREHAKSIYNQIREKTDLPIRYLIYTHGHMDHVNSAIVFKEEKTEIIAHENVKERFYKYEKLIGHRKRIGSVQFADLTTGAKSYDFIYPDIAFQSEYEFQLGGKTFKITHGKGETNDHCFVHIPEDDVVFCGDFFIWSFPNIGNPLKEVRYEREWYESLEKIQATNPAYLIPGHGDMFTDKAEIQKALQDVIDCLRFVHEEVAYHMNKGNSLEKMLDVIELPEHLEKSEYITPSYGCLMFAIKGTYRRYTGWFDGNPTNLQPAKQSNVAAELLNLITDENKVIERVKQLVAEGDYQMAMHLIDVVVQGSTSAEANKIKADITKKLAETNDNFIMRNIYNELANKLNAQLEGEGE